MWRSYCSLLEGQLPNYGWFPWCVVLRRWWQRSEVHRVLAYVRLDCQLLAFMKHRQLARVGENFTPKAAECATYARQLFTMSATNREMPCPEALVDLGKLRKVIWFRFGLRFAGV